MHPHARPTRPGSRPSPCPTCPLPTTPHAQVAWWDAERSCWSIDGVSNGHLKSHGQVLSFQTAHMGALAVVQSRTRLCPYHFWSVRPTGGRGGATAAVTLDVGLQEKLVFEVGGTRGCGCVRDCGAGGENVVPWCGWVER